MSTTSWGALREQAKAAGGGSFDPLPVGEYDVEVETCEAGQAKTGADAWKLKCRVLDGPHENRRVWCDIYLNREKPGSIAMFFDQMEAIGLDEQFFATGPSNEQVADAIVGRNIRVKLKNETYRGETKTKFEKVVKAGNGGPAVSAPAPTPAPTPPSGDVKPPF